MRAALLLLAGAVLAGAAERRSIQPMLFSEVTLDDASIQAKAATLNTVYMLEILDPDRLIWTFRDNAKLPAPGLPYQGSWEDPGCEVRGQFTGHYLSALSFIYNSTGDKKARSRIVNAL